MRFIIISIIALIIVYVIKVDLEEGTIPKASFYEEYEEYEEYQPCEEESLNYVAVVVQPDDTIYSLFAATPSPIKTTFPERLSQFYKLNPHLQLQSLAPGETVRIPLTVNAMDSCTN